MAIIDISLRRRRRFFGAVEAAHCCNAFRPQVEVLEPRECLSIAAPTGLQLAVLSSTQVSLTWNDVAGAQGYEILRWDGSNTIVMAQVPQGTTTWTLNGLQAFQTQWLTVEAFNGTSNAQAPWASVNTPPAPITTPTNLHVAGVTQTQATLQWGLATGATGYSIYGWDGANDVLVGTVSATTTTFVVSKLMPGSSNYFYVESFNATNSAVTDWVLATTTAPPVTAPTNLTAHAVNAGAIALSWHAASGQTGYSIYRWDGNSALAPVLVTTLAASATSYQAAGFSAGTTHWFYVQAFNANNSATTAWVQATTTGGGPLQPPTQLVATAASATSVLLTWVDPPNALGYEVFVWNGSTWAPVKTLAAGSHQALITGLATGHMQWFMVEALTAIAANASYSSAVYANL